MFDQMTRKELLEIAADRDIRGRHDMTKAELIDVLAGNEISVEVVLETKKRKPSMNLRDEDGNVIRRGRNLSGNVPYKAKFYYLDEKLADPEAWTAEYREAFDVAPNQVQLIIRWMAEAGITSADESLQGKQIVQTAKEYGKLASKIPSANLFAYYRRLLETLGVKQA